VSDTAQSRVRAARRFLRLVAGWHEVAWYLGWTRNLLSKALLRIRKRSKSALKLKQQLKLCVCVGARARARARARVCKKGSHNNKIRTHARTHARAREHTHGAYCR